MNDALRYTEGYWVACATVLSTLVVALVLEPRSLLQRVDHGGGWWLRIWLGAMAIALIGVAIVIPQDLAEIPHSPSRAGGLAVANEILISATLGVLAGGPAGALIRRLTRRAPAWN